MVVILPVFRAILMGAGTLFALHLTNPQLTEPLYELTLAGAKELTAFGANALSSRFDIFPWLLNTGAAWNSIYRAEKVKHALGQWYETEEHCALYPTRAVETLEENAKWPGLLKVDLPNSPLHTIDNGKELVVFPQHFIKIDVCTPGEIGWWDADAAAAFEAAMGEIVDVSILPVPLDQGVCVARCNKTTAANGTMTTPTAFFQPTSKTTAVVVEPAIAQPINTFTAGFHAHVSGLSLHGHIPSITSASEIAPLAVPEPANVTKVHALVHWDREVQPYQRAVLHARAAGQVHWYIIITGCLILVLSVRVTPNKTMDKDVPVGTNASIWAPKDSANTNNMPVTEAPTAYAATSAVEDSIPLACGLTGSGSGVVTGSGHSDATPTVPHNSAIVNLEQYKLDQSCLSDAAMNELAAAAWSKRTWGGKKRLFTLLPAFKEAINENAVASTSKVPSPAITTRTSSAPPTADPALAPAPALVSELGPTPVLAPAPALVPAPVPAPALNAQQRRAKKRRAAQLEEQRIQEEEKNAAWAAQTAVLTGMNKDTPLDSVYGADWKERFPQMQERLLATRWLTVYPEGAAAAVEEEEETA